MSTAPVTAVVVTYNSAATIRRCLLSLWAAGISDIVVVDNASRDDTTRLVAQLGLTPLRASRNQGFAAACNIGAASSRSPYLLFLNPDAAIHPAAPARVLRQFAEQPALGAVGLHLESRDGQPEPGHFGRAVTPLELVRRQLVPAAPVTAATSPFGVDWVSGAALWVRAAAFRAVRGFDTQFFMYWEDVDLCRRLAASGWHVMVHPAAVATHERGSSLTDNTRRTQLYDAAADRYFRKHYAAPVWYCHRLMRRAWRRFSPQAR